MWKVLNKEVDLGEPTSFLDHENLVCTQWHLWNKQKYCGQLQNHVRIANFSGVNWKASILREFSYFFMVLWYARSCEEMRGAILWVNTKTTEQLYKVSTPCIDDHHFKEEEMKSVGEVSQVCSLGRIRRPDILWSVNKLARSITKWTKACDKRLNRLTSIQIIITHVNTDNIVMCVILQNNAGWNCFKTPTSREILRTPNLLLVEHGASWEVIQLFHWVGCVRSKLPVSHSSTETEIISLDAEKRLESIPALDSWNLIVSVLGNTTQNHDREG